MCVSRMTAGCQGGCFSGNRKMGGAPAQEGQMVLVETLQRERGALQHSEEDKQNMEA